MSGRENKTETAKEDVDVDMHCPSLCRENPIPQLWYTLTADANQTDENV